MHDLFLDRAAACYGNLIQADGRLRGVTAIDALFTDTGRAYRSIVHMIMRMNAKYAGMLFACTYARCTAVVTCLIIAAKSDSGVSATTSHTLLT